MTPHTPADQDLATDEQDLAFVADLVRRQELNDELLAATVPNYGQFEELDEETRSAQVARLIADGADPNVVSVKNGNTPLSHAVLRRDRALLDQLISLGARIDLPAASPRQTPALHLAAWQGDQDTVLHLLSVGASIDHRDAQGQTALFHASMNDHLAVMTLLVERGAALDARDANGHTALENLVLRVPVEGTADHWRETIDALLDCYAPSQRNDAIRSAMETLATTDRFEGDRVSQKVAYRTKLHLEDLLENLPASAETTLTPEPTWETVHHITNYFDHPLEGLANFNGAPHVFFLADEIVRHIPSPTGQPDEDDYEVDTVYALHPVSEEIVADLIEKHAIFERWHQAYTAKQATHADHPALPSDRARHQALVDKLAPVLATLRNTPAPFLRQGQFVRGRVPVALGESAWKSYQVRWSAE